MVVLPYFIDFCSDKFAFFTEVWVCVCVCVCVCMCVCVCVCVFLYLCNAGFLTVTVIQHKL